LRGGEPALETALYAYLAAPAWWLGDVSDAYGAIKFLGVLLMTGAIFPAYGLARLWLDRPYALFAAVATAAAPALSYSPFLVDEPLAYTASALGLFLIGRLAVAPTWGRGLLAFAGCLVALLVRSQLVVLFAVLGGVLAFHAWRSTRVRAWRSGWTTGDWVGAAVLCVGAAMALSAYLGHHVFAWYVATTFFKGRILEYGLWAVGALAIGIGVLPLIAALAVAVRPGVRDTRLQSYSVVALVSVTVIGFYTAVKAAYLSTTLAVVAAERNLIYLYPIVFVGTALLLERRRASLVAVAAATVFVAYLVSSTPYFLGTYPNYEAHGLAIAAFANRIFRWPEATIETALVLIALGSGVALLALGRLRSRVASVAAAAIAVLVVGWSLTTEIYAANGERYASDAAYANLPKPPDWIERTANGADTIFVGQGIDGPSAWQVEFWNPNVRWFWGLDGSAPGPGMRVTPDLDKPDGTHRPNFGAEYALAVNGVDLAAPEVTRAGGAVLYRLGGDPVRLVQATSGISPDGWMARDASFTRYEVEPGTRGVTVHFSREAACGAPGVRVRARVGPVVIDANDQPAIGSVTDRGSALLEPCEATGVFLRVPPGPWRVEAEVEDTFVPAEIDAGSGDRRELGARVSFQPAGV
jgi:hypothetical protein